MRLLHASVVAVLRYPVKSARGERLRAVDVDLEGLRWDRAWACLDPADGTVGSAKHPGRWGRLLQVSAEVDDRNGEGAVTTDVVPERASLHRRLPHQADLIPEWLGDARGGQEMVTEVAGARPGGRFLDFGAVHLLSIGALAGLARELRRPSVDASRFWPNLVLDVPRDLEIGQELHIGDVALRVVLPTPRCVVPGLIPDAVPTAVDQQLLGTLARRHRTVVSDLGRAACFGVYAEVLHPGCIKLGQSGR